VSRSVLLLFVLFTSVQAAAAQGFPRLWSPDDRIILGDFTTITSIAAGPDRVFITGPASMIAWNPRSRRWLGPFDPPDASYLSGVFASLLDPIDYSAWLVRQSGWTRYDANIDAWDRGTIPARVTGIAFDRNDPVAGPYFQTTGGWYQVARGSMIASPSRGPSQPEFPLSIREVFRENPWFEANQAAVLQSARLGTARFTVAARAYDRQGWYLGTAGAGLLFAEEGAPVPKPLPFGLPSPIVGGLFSGPRGVWVATDRTASSEANLTFVERSLTEFVTLEGSTVFGVRFNRATRVVGQGASLWVASDIGVIRVSTDGRTVDVFDEARGLPDRRVLSLAARHGQVVVGTARGLVLITDSLDVERLAPDFAGVVLAVAMAGDTVWTGTRLGVFAVMPGSNDLQRPVRLGTEPSLRQPALDLTWVGDTLVAVTPDRVQWRDPATGTWTLGPLLSAQLGRLYRGIPDAGGIWVAGERGVGFATLETPPARVLLLGRDLPAEPNDLAVDQQFLWVATDRGLVRWRLDAVRP
jgi:hypothetical protein